MYPCNFPLLQEFRKYDSVDRLRKSNLGFSNPRNTHRGIQTWYSNSVQYKRKNSEIRIQVIYSNQEIPQLLQYREKYPRDSTLTFSSAVSPEDELGSPELSREPHDGEDELPDQATRHQPAAHQHQPPPPQQPQHGDDTTSRAESRSTNAPLDHFGVHDE